MSRTLFVTGTGTGVGKTWVTRGLARALANRGHRVAALKPIETGCAPDALDAQALGRACGQPALANAPGLYRAVAPLAPYAATLRGAPPPPSIDALAKSIRNATEDEGIVLVEGAGGVLVPIDATHSIADLIIALGAPVLLVAQNSLGVISFTLTALEALQHRGITVRAIAVTETSAPRDESQHSNVAVLSDLTGLRVCSFPETNDDDQVLAHVAKDSGLLEACQL